MLGLKRSIQTATAKIVFLIACLRANTLKPHQKQVPHIWKKHDNIPL
jgi:hypothetical protein